MTALEWGRRYLMCPPEHFGVLYEINPWMHREVTVDRDLSRAQWEQLVTDLRTAGAEVETIEPQEDVPDLVFTANAGLVSGDRFVPSHFRHPERQPETEVFASWFATARLGRSTGSRPGSATKARATRCRSTARCCAATAPVPTRPPARCCLVSLGAPVRTIELIDERLYHVDLTFCPLDERHALCAPMGWDRYGRAVVEAIVPEPLWLDDDEALSFCANSVVVGTTVVMPHVPTRVGRQLEAWGFTVVESAVGEFLKAGGGCRCLTLALDVTLGPQREAD